MNLRGHVTSEEVTQQLVEQVEDVFPGGSGLVSRTLAEVSRAVVDAQAVDAVGHQRQHPLRHTTHTCARLPRVHCCEWGQVIYDALMSRL